MVRAGTVTIRLMATDRQLRRKKTTAWINLVLGLLWLFIPLRNIYLPGFLSVAHASEPDRGSLAIAQVTAGIIWLAAAWIGFSSIRRNPEGKTEPAVQTLFGASGKST